MKDHRDALTRLAFAGLAPRKVDKLVDRFDGASGAVQAIMSNRSGTEPQVRAAVAPSADDRCVELERIGARLVLEGDPGFPVRLGRLRSPPRWLFTMGAVSDGPCVGIVGTRTCSRYGVELAEAYGRVCAEQGWSVVSGLARGIDAAAHRGVVGSGGHGHAVLGSGIDVVYPKTNRRLRDDLLAGGGAISSEYPPGTRPDRWRFPTRNRIIAGSADIVVVVEAGESGGALITARIAIESGVPVWATPGDIDRPASIGTNGLIRDGAFPVFGGDDLGMALDLVQPFAA